MIESFTQVKCDLKNLDALQCRLMEVIKMKRVLIVLDDVWNSDIGIWVSFRTLLTEASIAKILVTTRIELDYLPKESRLELGYLPKEPCWQLFKQHAFGSQTEVSNLVQIGKQIVNKCGMLPLVVKSIASLLGHEGKEISTWRNILRDIEEGELWERDESNLSRDIFAPLKVSYARLPTCLKPCFLYCSMFPKDFVYAKELMVKLWISQGYVTFKGRKNAEEIGWEYAKQLEQRSLFESIVNTDGTRSSTKFKLHYMIHDLALLNSKNSNFSIKVDMANYTLPKCAEELHHLVIAFSYNSVEHTPLREFPYFPNLRTLIILNLNSAEFLGNFHLSRISKLRALSIEMNIYSPTNYEHNFDYIISFDKLKHLRYFSLTHFSFDCLPECICSLYHLKSLELNSCALKELPTEIGNLISLEKLVIWQVPCLKKLPESLGQLKTLRIIVLYCCHQLKELPKSFQNLVSLTNVVIRLCRALKWSPDQSLCHVKALRVLDIDCNQVGPLPNRLIRKFRSIDETLIRVRVKCETIGWLNNFVGLVQVLRLVLLENFTNLEDVRCANLASMQYLDHLQLCWNCNDKQIADSDNEFVLIAEEGQNQKLDHYVVMASLQPHPNLRELYIADYGGISFPQWIEDPNPCASLESVTIKFCDKLTSVRFGSLRKLKHLEISHCDSLQIFGADSLPLELEELHISGCNRLVSMPGIQKLKSLLKLFIDSCDNLQHLLVTDADSSTNLTMRTVEFSDQNSLLAEILCSICLLFSKKKYSSLGLRNLTTLRKLMIVDCPKLQLPTDEKLCQYCEARIWDCPLLENWCLHQGIKYTHDERSREEEEQGWSRSYNLRPAGIWNNIYTYHPSFSSNHSLRI